MARYTAASKERVREVVDMVDLVSARTELRKSGADSYTGLCPFHEERSPSFSVKPSDKLFYCFGCQAAGDVFTFVMLSEGVDFPGALELLADRYGVTLELEAEDPTAAAERAARERLLALLERACGYYERYLWESTEARAAREYLLGRGLEEATLREFRVGYAPSAWDRILLASKRGGFTEAELIAVDLVQRSQQRPGSVYDRFRSRIMFPLCDLRGRVLGFGARATGERQQPKYINTSVTEVFQKGRHVFAGHVARSAAAKAGAVIVCEGYTDVIAMHQAGLRNAVGLMGTSLTEEQLATLGRLAPTVQLALDADAAGQEAVLRAARVAARRSLDLRVVVLPAGSDPADLLEREGSGAVASLVSQAMPFVRFRVERTLAGGDPTTPEGRDELLGALRPVFAEVGPGAMRLELEKLVSGRLSLPESMVGSVLEAPTTAAPGEGRGAAFLDARERSERTFLALCIALPRLGGPALASLDIERHFTSQLTRRAAGHLREHLQAPSSGVDDADLAALLAELSVRASSLPAHPAQLETERLQLELARLDREIAATRSAGSGGLSELGASRRAVKTQLDEAFGLALDQTAAQPR